MNPASSDPWLGQGDVQVARKKWSAAQKAFEEAQRLDPQQAEPLLRLSNLAEQRDKMGKAREYARKAIEVDPNSAPAYSALGRLQQERDKMAEAADALLKAIQLDARQHAAYNRWMWSYTDIQRQPYNVDRSRLEAELAKIAEGDQAETVWAQTLLGLGYLTLEEVEKAIEHLEKAAAMDPAYVELYRDLALANEAARDGSKALEWWQRYLYAAGPAADLSEIQEQIENLKLVQIEGPEAGAKVSGKVEIVGTAKGKGFVSYKLEVRSVGSESWSTIATGTDRVTSETLGIWDTAGLSPGEYQLRLDVTLSDEEIPPYHLVTVEVEP
jgi:tetratricopeptide (TPR) repeat protein